MKIVKKESGTFIYNDSDVLIKKVSSEMSVDYSNETELIAFNSYDKVVIPYVPGTAGSEVLLQPEGSGSATPFAGTIRELLEELGTNFFKGGTAGSVDLSPYSTTLQMDAAINQAKDDLLDGAGPAYDTLKELQDELQADDITITQILLNQANKRDLDANKNSIQDDAGDLQLVGDVGTPGRNKFYGTDDAGVQGWHEFPIPVRNNFDANVSDVLYTDDYITLNWDSVNNKPTYTIPTTTPLGAWGWHDINVKLVLGNAQTWRRRGDDVSSATGTFYFSQGGTQDAQFDMTNYGASGFYSVMKETLVAGFPRYSMWLMIGDTGHGSVLIFKTN